MTELEEKILQGYFHQNDIVIYKGHQLIIDKFLKHDEFRISKSWQSGGAYYINKICGVKVPIMYCSHWFYNRILEVL